MLFVFLALNSTFAQHPYKIIFALLMLPFQSQESLDMKSICGVWEMYEIKT